MNAISNVDFFNYGLIARRKIIEIANRVGGAHIGGCFSIIDFLLVFYSMQRQRFISSAEEYYYGKISDGDRLVFSKGHCYLAQLVALDLIFADCHYSKKYLTPDTPYFGHPKRDSLNFHFPVSAGALGQGVVFANGLAYADLLSNKSRWTLSVIGDGEFLEGSVVESVRFAAHHHLNHCFVVDNNKQISLGGTSDILNIGDIEKSFAAMGVSGVKLRGHELQDLQSGLSFPTDRSGPKYLLLETVKGKGVSFMERSAKWHHRRFKGSEYGDAMNELGCDLR